MRGGNKAARLRILLGDDFVTSAPRHRSSAREPTTAQSTTTTYTSLLHLRSAQLAPTVRSVAKHLSTARLVQMAASLVIASTMITRARRVGMASTQIRTLGTASPARRGYAGFRKSWGVIRAARNFF